MDEDGHEDPQRRSVVSGKGVGLLTGAIGVAGLAGAAKAAFGEFSEMQKVTAQTGAVLKSTGKAAERRRRNRSRTWPAPSRT